MILSYFCVPILLTAVFSIGAPAGVQQGPPPRQAQNQPALRTPDSSSRRAAAGGTALAQDVEVSRVGITNADNYTRITVELGGRAKYQAARIQDPDRIYLDLENARLSNELLHQPIDIPSGSYLKALRVAQNRSDVVRVVLDVAKVKDYSIFELADPGRLVVDLYGPADSAAAAANSAPKASADATGLAPGAAAPAASTAKTAHLETPPSPAVGPLPLSAKASPSLLPMPISFRVATVTAVPPSPALKTMADGMGPVPAAKPTLATSAQGTAPVRGVVQDPDGTAVPEADVDLTTATGGQPLTTTTDEEGDFEFSKVPPGDYVLRVNVAGFEPVERPIAVGSGPIADIRVKLKIAQVSEKVIVSGQAIPLAEENRNQVQFNQQAVMNLPAKDDNPLTVPSLFLNPAVVGASGPTIIVDGVETSSLDLPASSVKSVTVDENPYSGEFGRPGKGRLQVTTRQGAHSRYRGDVTALFRNSALDARNALALARPLQQ